MSSTEPWFDGKAIVFEGRRFVRVFQEDECLLRDPTATHIHNAFQGFTGETFADTRYDERYDQGDTLIDVYRGFGVIVAGSFDGSALYVEESRIPFAALFGQRWVFEGWMRIAAGFRQMVDPDPHFSSTHRLVALGDLAHAVSQALQNEGPLTEADVLEAERLLETFDLQIPNVVEELQRLSASARRRLVEARNTRFHEAAKTVASAKGPTQPPTPNPQLPAAATSLASPSTLESR